MKTRNITIILLLSMMSMRPSVSNAEPFSMPQLPEHEIRESRIHYEGKKFDPEALSLSQRLLYLESPEFMSSDTRWIGEGKERRLVYVRVEHLNNKNKAINTVYFKPGNKYLITDKVEKVIESPSGRKLREEFYYISHPIYDYPDDTLHSYTVEIAIRSLPLDKPGAKRSFHIWLPPAAIIPMEIRIGNKETIKLPIGARECYRAEMRPLMTAFLGQFVGRAIQPLVPSYRYWFSTQGTHPIMRFKGPMGKLNVIGVPDEVYNVVKIDPDPAKTE